jgi:hypothetical protein
MAGGSARRARGLCWGSPTEERSGAVATWDDVRELAMAMPEAAQSAHAESLEWRVREKLFAWERPLRRPDLAALGAHAPSGPILAARVADLDARERLLAAAPDVYFTTPHFAGYPAVLVRLPEISRGELGELIAEAWICRAPKRLVAAWEKERSNPGR